MFMFFLFHCYAHHRNLHSFPTRRSSDLDLYAAFVRDAAVPQRFVDALVAVRELGVLPHHGDSSARSEEHTSELQSHSDLVCRLLLEKKKKMFTVTIPCNLLNHTK